MKAKVIILCSALLAAVAQPLAASTVYQFANACSSTTVGSFKVCASAEVTILATGELVINVWNLNDPTPLGSNGYPTDLDSYYSATGGWHTITSIGLSNLSYSGTGTVTASYYDGASFQNLSYWAGDANANALQIYNTGSSTQGIQEGIVGCFDPGPTSANHVSTCNSYPVAPYVQFTITGLTAIDLTNAVFEFHGQQVAGITCDPTNWSSACTEASLKGSGGIDGTATVETVTPEPITLILLGSGLLGIGGAAERRRRAQIESA